MVILQMAIFNHQHRDLEPHPIEKKWEWLVLLFSELYHVLEVLIACMTSVVDRNVVVHILANFGD